MNKSKRIIALLLVALSILTGTVLSAPAHAVGGGGGGGGSGGGGITGCESTWFLATCYGAGWQYYSTTSDYVSIDGYSTIAPSGTIVGCGKYGGYWRYAMIAQNSGHGFSAGQQVGIGSFGFGGASSASYASTHYGGGMVYRGVDLSTVRAAWSNAYNSENFTYNGSNPNWDDSYNDLGWFCSGDPGGTTPCTECGCPGVPCPEDPGSCPISAPSYSSDINYGTSATNSASRNRTTGTGWQEWVYAKPTDDADYTHCLFPGAQAVRHSTFHGEEGIGIQNTANGPQEKITATSNNMNVQRFNLWGNQTFSYTIGSTTIKNETSNVYTITRDDEGKDLTQTSSASIGSADSGNEGTHSWLYYHVWVPKTCYRTVATGVDAEGNTTYGEESYDCSYWDDRYSSHSNNYYSGSVGGSSSGVTAHVYVPYNFTTDVRIDSIGNNPVYSGESTSVNYHVNINTRENSTTKGTGSKQYATKTPSDTVVQLVSFYYDESKSANAYLVTGAITSSDPCSFYGAKGGKNCKQINHPGSLSTNTGSNGLGVSTRHDYSDPVSVYDAPAGSKFCVAVGINHADSGNDTNNNGAGTVNNNWNISNASCRTIVKKPNMQVWGASIYTTGNITTSASKKTYYNNSNSTHLFSSWVEYGIITNGKVNFSSNLGLASGASTGYQSAYTGTPITGGLTQNLGDNCYRSPLTISNRDCNNIGQSGITLNTTFLERLKSRFFVENRSEYTFNGSNLNLLTSHKELESGTGYRYTRVNGAATITSAPILTNGATHIVYATGDININANLLYADSPVVNGLPGTGYSSISQVPQYIIYSESGNIKISENVTQIDAWLIAPNGTVNTCSKFNIGTSSARDCSSQLTVNGPVIAKNLILNRTSGGDNGIASATPAEIFNLTPATYLWAYSQARNYPQAFTTYMRQLAPRY